MSRIGKLPIKLPKGVTLTVSPANEVTVKGKIGELKQMVDSRIKVSVKEDEIIVERSSEEKQDKSLHGLYRSLIQNMVTGVSEGYTIQMELVGVGYKAEAKGNILELSLGYSHDLFIQMPNEVKVETKQEKKETPKIILTSADKQLIGNIAAKIRSFREPEPYKGKGVKFVGEVLRRKAGKAASV